MSDIAKYIGNAEEFPVLKHWDFFQHAGASPLPRVVADAMRKVIADTETSAYLVGNRYAELVTVRDAAATMINAQRDEIALLKNTAEGISIVANAIDWKPGDRIVTAAKEYPANVYPWMDVARRHGLELVMVPEVVDPDGRRKVPLDALLREAAHERTRIVTLSHVQFASGQRLDLARIGAFCRQRGIPFCVDAIQSMGVMPIDVTTMHIDYLAAGGQKWLLGPEGAAIFYCRRELIEKTPPLVIGAMNVVNNTDYCDYDCTYKPTAARFESGTYNIVGLFGLRESMTLLHGIGVEAVSQRIRQLTDRLITALLERGYRIASPRGGDDWSGIVSFASPVHNHDTVVRTLRKEQRTEIVVRDGRLRASPHFYNTEEQIDRLVAHLPSH
jgi:cysteine desulfurase/selenocysteine lyase